MNQEDRDAIIAEAFGFLDDIKVHEINGVMMLGDDNLPFNVSAVITEKTFVSKWLLQFAVGYKFQRNYFNSSEWGSFTNQGSRSVMIIDEDKKPVIIIPPMTHINLTADDKLLLRDISRFIEQISKDQTRKLDVSASMPAAKHMGQALQAEAKSYEHMIPGWFYEKHGIIPTVETNIIYIKDFLYPNENVLSELNRARPILYRDFRGELSSLADYEFIREFMKQWELPDLEEKMQMVRTGKTTVKGVDKDTPTVSDDDRDPFEC